VTRVLIIDDEPLVLESTRRVLDLMGYETTGASDARRIVDRIREERPHVVLQDVRMPGLDVEGLLHAIREDPQIRGTRVILFSADLDLSLLQDRLHADGVLPKPFRPDEAEAAIERTGPDD
jgi:two-component system C4-dicarboxylate transport response regulator DctD